MRNCFSPEELVAVGDNDFPLCPTLPMQEGEALAQPA